MCDGLSEYYSPLGYTRSQNRIFDFEGKSQNRFDFEGESQNRFDNTDDVGNDNESYFNQRCYCPYCGISNLLIDNGLVAIYIDNNKVTADLKCCECGGLFKLYNIVK